MSRCVVGVARVWRSRRDFPASRLLQCRRLTGGEWAQDDFLELCRRRKFLLGKNLRAASIVGGHHSLGPLGAQMKMNIVQKWWEAVVLHRDQVLPIDSLCHLPPISDPSLRSATTSRPRLHRNPTREQLGKMADLRQDLLYGALLNYPSYLELMNRKLPFGIAEVGRCFRPITDDEDADTGRVGEGTAASLVWFSSAKTCSQWQDYWLRQRLLWWRKFAQVPSRFSSAHHHDEGGIKSFVIRYDFPWGQEPIERVSSMDESTLTMVHREAVADLQARDGRKSAVPHVVWLSGNVEQGLLAYLCDAMQVTKGPGAHRKEQQRTVLKIHPVLTPVKAAIDMGSGPTAELRLVCEGLSTELRGRGMPVWPGYRETLPNRTEQLHAKYDEMGVLFAASVSDVTLESGLIQLRGRDTTIKETMHISKLAAFLTQHIASADKL